MSSNANMQHFPPFTNGSRLRLSRNNHANEQSQLKGSADINLLTLSLWSYISLLQFVIEEEIHHAKLQYNIKYKVYTEK